MVKMTTTAPSRTATSPMLPEVNETFEASNPISDTVVLEF